MEEKVYKSNKISLELLRQLKDAEVEIEALTRYIHELQKKVTIYLPARNDALDKRLADLINNSHKEHLKFLFVRDGEGVYFFGQKRINLKLEKQEIKVRVGGGYLSLDEFLD